MFAGLFCAALLAAPSGQAWYRDEGSFYYPTAGIVGRKAGTIEVTLAPNEDLASDIAGWPFAFAVLNREKDDKAKTILGLFHPPRERFSDASAMVALVRTPSGSATAREVSPPVKAGERMNYAVTWGPSGKIRLYRDGREVACGPFSGEAYALSPYLEVGDRAPFRVSRIRVSAKELTAAELGADPMVPYAESPVATLIANRLDAPRFFARRELADTPAVCPFDRFAARVVREGTPVKLGFSVANAGARTRIAESVRVGARCYPVVFDVPAKTAGARMDVSLGPLPSGLHAVEAFGCRFRISVLPHNELPEGPLADYLGISLIRDAELVSACGIRWERLWNEHELLWFQVEPRAGEWDFRDADRTIASARAKGIRLLATLGYGPSWAVERPAVTAANEKLFSPSVGTWKPKDLPAWERYVQTVAERYRGKIDHWEIWNEIDWMPPARAASFTGTPTDYLELLKRAHGRLKAVDPANRVVVSGFGTGNALTENVYSNLCEMGATDYCDIWNMHAYLIRAKAAAYRDVPRRYKNDMPVWQTEFMWHVLTDPVRRAYLGPAIQNWFLEDGYARFFAFGIDYLTDRHSHSVEPSLHTISVHQSFLEGCAAFCGRLPGLPSSDFDVAHGFRRTDGTWLSMVGSSSGKYALHLSETPLDVRDMYGVPVPVAGCRLVLDGSFLYVLTRRPLKVMGFEVMEAKQLVPNAGFEDLVGDDLDGIDKCRFEGWQVRTQRDPSGFVGVSTNALAGRYSARLKASAAGKSVYLFQSIRLPGGGSYRMTAKARVLSGSPRAFLRLFEQKANGRTWERFQPLDASRPEVDLHFNLNIVGAPDTAVAAIVGIEDSGEVLVDDIRLVPSEPVAYDEDEALCPALPEGARELRRSADEVIDLGAASPLGTGIRYCGGVPFRLSGGWLVAAGNGWRGAAGRNEIRLDGVWASEICLLGGTMFLSKGCTYAADLELCYQSGESERLPVFVGQDLRDWYLVGHPEAKPVVRWEAPGSGLEYGLFLARFRNPHPEKSLVGIRLHPRDTGIVAVRAVSLRRVRGPVGVAMRYDDNHKVDEWMALARQFEERGMRMSLAVIPSSRHWLTPAHWATLKALADRGHEIMDHTPQHALYRMDFETRTEYLAFRNRNLPFVREADDGGLKLFCRGEVDWNCPDNRRFRVSVHGKNNACRLTFSDPADEARIRWTNKIYIPSRKAFYGVAIEGGQKILRDFWGRGVALDIDDEEVLYVADKAFELPDELLREQTARSVRAFAAHGIPAPRTWCQPGGWEPFAPAANVARICGGEFGYNGGSCVPGSTRRSFAYDAPNASVARFAIRPCPYVDDGFSLEEIKKNVREVLSDSRVVLILSHMSPRRIGSWEAWLALNGQFLDWLKEEGIAVKPPAEWSDIVYGKVGGGCRDSETK